LPFAGDTVLSRRGARDHRCAGAATGGRAAGRWDVDCESWANNHGLEYGRSALLDTFHQPITAGVRWVGAGADIVELEMVPGAGHLVEEPGALERISDLSVDRFRRRLPVPDPPP
jgi:hypothetical protein